MRKATEMLPNGQLRRERQRRGWSREYVAERIGIADPKTIGRWERGVAFPSSCFLQRLCELFGMLAQDLGLFQEGYSVHAQALSLRSQDNPNSTILPSVFPLYDPVIPPPYAEIEGLIGRSRLLSHLKQRLCASKSPALAALNGLPGVGKTAITIELTYDSDLRRHFCDGVLWVALGPGPDVLGQLGRWGTMLGLTPAEMEQLRSEEALARAICAIIGTRRMLLIIDDAWRSEEALAFKVGGPNCAYLLTTRIPSVALHFANDGTAVVQELDEEDGLRLLARFVPDVVTEEPSTARTVVQSVGGLPLALTLMGKYLQLQSYGGQSRRLRAGLERLQHAQERLQLAMFRAPLERHMGLAEGTLLSLAATIEVSTRQLDEEAQNVLSALSVFPAKPHSFSEEAALAVSAASVDALDALVDAGVLQCTGHGRYTLHQAIADYASARRNVAETSERMVGYFLNYLERHITDDEALSQETDNILAAIQVACDQRMYCAFLRGVIAFFPFLQLRGLGKLTETQLERVEQVARSLSDTSDLMGVFSHQDETVYPQGNNRCLPIYYQRDPVLTCDTLQQRLNDFFTDLCMSVQKVPMSKLLLL
jgi:transcriptional regulator with XRE-family HTH domain